MSTTASESDLLAKLDALSSCVEANPAMLRRITFLGTSSAVPCPGRCNVSSLVLHLSTGNNIMVDCGEATQHQIMRAKNVKMSRIGVILITHLHGDHFFGLFGMLATLGTHGRTDPVTVVGPKGLKNAIESVFIASENSEDADEQTYDLKIIEIPTDVPSVIYGSDFMEDDSTKYTLNNSPGVEIVAVPIEHRVPCVGYMVQERSRSGNLDVTKAKELGAQTLQLRELKNGKDVIASTGQVIRSRDVVTGNTLGKRVAVLQDTHDPNKFLSVLKGVDVLIHECTYDDQMRDKAIQCGHSTPSMASDVAMACEAKHLILTHFSSRYDKEVLYKAEDGRVLYGMNHNAVPEEAATKKLKDESKKLKPTVLDLHREAVERLQTCHANTPVSLAADFRVFEWDKNGSLIQFEEADVHLNKMF